jgi:hypothetical protein
MNWYEGQSTIIRQCCHCFEADALLATRVSFTLGFFGGPWMGDNAWCLPKQHTIFLLRGWPERYWGSQVLSLVSWCARLAPCRKNQLVLTKSTTVWKTPSCCWLEIDQMALLSRQSSSHFWRNRLQDYIWKLWSHRSLPLCHRFPATQILLSGQHRD